MANTVTVSSVKFLSIQHLKVHFAKQRQQLRLVSLTFDWCPLSFSFQAPHFAAEFDRALSAIGLGALKPVAVVHDQTAIEVFRLMAAKNISGVPVVDDVGTWVGNVSGSDLKVFFISLCYFSQSIKTDGLYFPLESGVWEFCRVSNQFSFYFTYRS